MVSLGWFVVRTPGDGRRLVSGLRWLANGGDPIDVLG